MWLMASINVCMKEGYAIDSLLLIMKSGKNTR
jgi:hypothetical protein